MKSKILFIALGVTLSIALNGIANEGANPFYPIFSSTSSGATDAYIEGEDAEGEHPLQQYPVKKYILMGTLSSIKGEIGLIRAKNGNEYFVRFGDLLGNNDGKVSKIHSNGIEVAEKDQIVTLSVRNRSTSNAKNK
jgi:Tfp pilus assembly protein PilP